MPIANTRLEKLQLTKLLQSVRVADRDSVEKLIVSGIPNLVNYVDADSPGGDSALGLAARANADAVVGQLLGLGADPDVVDLMERTAAMKAAEYGHWQSLEKLAEAGADMTLTDCEGKGAFAWKYWSHAIIFLVAFSIWDCGFLCFDLHRCCFP